MQFKRPGLSPAFFVEIGPRHSPVPPCPPVKPGAPPYRGNPPNAASQCPAASRNQATTGLKTLWPFRLRTLEPRIVGPRYGDPSSEQPRFIPTASANNKSHAPSATQSPCRGVGPTMRGGPKGLDSAPVAKTRAAMALTSR